MTNRTAGRVAREVDLDRALKQAAKFIGRLQRSINFETPFRDGQYDLGLLKGALVRLGYLKRTRAGGRDQYLPPELIERLASIKR